VDHRLMSPAGSGRSQFQGGSGARAVGREARRRRAELVGARIRLARRANGLSRAELAKLLHDTRAHIARWEDGCHEPSASNLQRLGEVLEVPLWFFLGGPPAGA